MTPYDYLASPSALLNHEGKEYVQERFWTIRQLSKDVSPREEKTWLLVLVHKMYRVDTSHDTAAAALYDHGLFSCAIPQGQSHVINLDGTRRHRCLVQSKIVVTRPTQVFSCQFSVISNNGY